MEFISSLSKRRLPRIGRVKLLRGAGELELEKAKVGVCDRVHCERQSCASELGFRLSLEGLLGVAGVKNKSWEREKCCMFLLHSRNVGGLHSVPGALLDKSTSVRIKELRTDPM